MQCCIVLSSWMQLSSWVNNRAAHWSQEVMSWAELQWQPLRKKKYGSVGWSQEASENWVTGALTDRKPPLKPGSDLTLLCAALPFQNKHWDRIWIPTILWICCREGATHWLRIWKLILKVVYYACCAAPWVALHDSQLKMMLFIFAVHPLSETSFLSFFFSELFSVFYFSSDWLPLRSLCSWWAGLLTQVEKRLLSHVHWPHYSSVLFAYTAYLQRQDVNSGIGCLNNSYVPFCVLRTWIVLEVKVLIHTLNIHTH